jgi:hypothetical protein
MILAKRGRGQGLRLEQIAAFVQGQAQICKPRELSEQGQNLLGKFFCESGDNSCDMDIIPIPGFSLYGVDQSGYLWKIRKSIYVTCAPRKLKPNKNKPNGYLKTVLKTEAGGVNVRVHRLVCLTFHGEPPPNKPLALHKNGIKTDNRMSNLYWGDQEENIADMRAMGQKSGGCFGLKGSWKFTQGQLENIKYLRSVSDMRLDDLAYLFDCSTKSIVRAVKMDNPISQKAV